jgi:hypothetical protein
MKLTARLCSAQAPLSSFVKIYFIYYLVKKLWLFGYTFTILLELFE